MPVTPTYPGVYIEELPSGVRTIVGVATSITAFVGYTARGPFNQAVRILSPGEYERTFGPLHRDSRVSYAVRQFFDNGGSDAYVVRVAQSVAVAAITMQDTAGNDVLQVEAANPGAWANQVTMDVDYDTANPDGTFNLTVVQHDQDTVVATETHRNLSMDSAGGQYAVDVVNAASKLVRVARDAGVSFTDQGLALSGDLGAGFTVTDTTITGLVDGAPFTLVLTGALPTTAATLETSLNAAITAAGLGSAMAAERANVLGAASATGTHVRLVSQVAGESSSVVIAAADPALRLGLGNGGREFPASAHRRPAPTGTQSGDLSDRIGVALALSNLEIEVTDRATGLSLVPATSLTLSTLDMGPPLRAAIETELRNIGHSATDNAVVALNGGRFVLRTSADTPNASITVSQGGGANGLRTESAQGGFENVQAYALGVGHTFGAQAGAAPGADGTPPTASELIGSFADKTGIYALRDVDVFNILCIPETAGLGDTEALSVIDKAIGFCESERAFYIVDPRLNRSFTDIADWVDTLPKSKNAAVYFPRIRAADPLNGFRLADMPASGAMAGVYSRTDTERGVWKSPAGIEATLRGTQALAANLTDAENGTLNPVGINTLRTFPVYGRVVWGARTLQGADAQASEWKYLAVRRTALFLEESLFRGLHWVVFEPNDEPLWAQIRLNVGAFMQDLFRKGAFQGTTPGEAYLVKCDAETTTQTDIDLGVVNILVGFAPLKPAEFVILKIQQLAGQQAT